MKTEEFDEIFRRKLQSIEPTVTAGEVEIIRRAVSGKTEIVAKWIIAAKYAFALLVGAGISSVILSNLNSDTKQANIELKLAVDSLKQQISEAIDLARYDKPKADVIANPETKLKHKIFATGKATKVENTQVAASGFTETPVQDYNRIRHTEADATLLSTVSLPVANLVQLKGTGFTTSEPLPAVLLPEPLRMKNPSQNVSGIGMAGVGCGYSAQTYTAGFYGQFRVWRSTFIYSGIQLGLPHEQYYFDDRDYERKHPRERFHKTYFEAKPDTSRYLNIRIDSRLVQLPVGAGFNVKLNRGYYMPLSVTATLNLLDFQELHFQEQQRPKPGGPQPLPPPITGELSKAMAPFRINDADLFTGIGKSWRAYSVQAGITFGYNFTAIASETPFSTGVRFRGFVHL